MLLIRSLLILLALFPAVQAQRLTLQPEKKHQTIDGFGVNFNGTYFRESQKKAIDLLVDDLGVTLVRFDPYGLTDWEAHNDNADAQVMDWDYYKDRYSTPAFEASWAAARYLNKKGAKLILNFSGAAPDWMLEVDPNGKHRQPDHLRHDMYPEFAETVVSAAVYARKYANVEFHLFNPVNETDCPPIEGSAVWPAEMPDLLLAITRRMKKEGLGDVKLVAADQCSPRLDFFSPILAQKEVMDNIAALSLHTYGGESLKPLVEQVKKASPRTPVWLTEYGDLNDKDRSAENEWASYCVKASDRLLRALNDGLSAALFWDAYDNYHEHDRAFTYYGLLSNDNHKYAPKKRYYAAKQVYRFVKPGAVRIGVEGAIPGVMVAAFQQGRSIVVVGMKQGGPEKFELNVPDGLEWKLYQTTRGLNCELTPGVSARPGGIEVRMEGDSIFTLEGAPKP